jgi:hypothetical protein
MKKKNNIGFNRATDNMLRKGGKEQSENASRLFSEGEK